MRCIHGLLVGFLVFSFSCSGDRNCFDVNIPERIFIGGPLPTDRNSGLPDCRELARYSENVHPGENCFLPPKLIEWIRSHAANLHPVIADLSLSLESYGSAPQYMVCEFPDGGSYNTEVLPTKTLAILEAFGSEDADSMHRAVFARCGSIDEPICTLIDTDQSYVTPGLSLLFLARNCCLDTWQSGSWVVYGIYPINQDVVFDFDGQGISLETVRSEIFEALAGGKAEGLPNFDMNCSDVGGEVSVSIFASFNAYLAARRSGQFLSSPSTPLPIPASLQP